jgi:hypothetical protein
VDDLACLSSDASTSRIGNQRGQALHLDLADAVLEDAAFLHADRRLPITSTWT